MPMVEFTFAPLGVLLVATFAFVVAFAPFIVLWIVAADRGASMAHVLWGFLGWIGVVIGLVIMLSAPRPADARPYRCPECGTPTATDARYCSRCGIALAVPRRDVPRPAGDRGTL